MQKGLFSLEFWAASGARYAEAYDARGISKAKIQRTAKAKDSGELFVIGRALRG